MLEGPGIARIAALIGDPARAQMLSALMAGEALTATELCSVAGVTKQTVSAHLAKMLDAGLVCVEAQGRHRYFRLAGSDVAQLIESLMGVAARTGAMRSLPGPRDPALRRARVCYDHLAGDVGVAIYERLASQRVIVDAAGTPALGAPACAFFAGLGIDVEALGSARRPLCRACLDWSVRKRHLAGALGAALLLRFIELGWARRARQSRIVHITPPGEQALRERFAFGANGGAR